MKIIRSIWKNFVGLVSLIYKLIGILPILIGIPFRYWGDKKTKGSLRDRYETLKVRITYLPGYNWLEEAIAIPKHRRVLWPERLLRKAFMVVTWPFRRGIDGILSRVILTQWFAILATIILVVMLVVNLHQANLDRMQWLEGIEQQAEGEVITDQALLDTCNYAAEKIRSGEATCTELFNAGLPGRCPAGNFPMCE